MREKMLRLLGYVAAVGIGTFPAIFVVFNSIFTDGSAIIERIVTFILTIVSYTILGLAFGFFSSAAPWKLSFWIVFPAIVIVTWYSAKETERLLLHLFYLVLAASATLFGTRAGSWLKTRRKSRSHLKS